MRPPSILILHDQLYADFVSKQVLAVNPSSSCTVVRGVDDARHALRASFDLFISREFADDGDTLDLIWECGHSSTRPHSIMVIASRCSARLIGSLRELPIAGLVDASTDSTDTIRHALNEVMEGRHFWTAAWGVYRIESEGIHSALRMLSPTERLVFAVIGDGSDDEAAADELGMKPSAVQTVRRNLHDKLNIHNRGDLVRTAVQLGFVRFEAKNVIRVGFGLLLADYLRRSKRPVELPAGITAAYPSLFNATPGVLR